MKIRSLGTMFMATALAVMTPQWAQAAGTGVCTPITNTASLEYWVGGIKQDDKPSNTESFNVASKVNLTVTASDATFVSVTPGQSQAVLTFTVKNDGNTVQDYLLTGLEKDGAVTNLFTAGGGSATDNFNGANYAVYVESGANAGYQVGEDTATFINELAPADPAATVYVVITGSPAVLLTQVNGDVAAYGLLVKTAQAGYSSDPGTETTAGKTAGACNAPIVLADTAAGTGPDDGNLDGDDSARGAFKVTSAMISINKVATTIWDPINYNDVPKSIPGAIVRYVVTIANDGAATSPATLTSIGDTLVGSLAFDPDLKTGNLNTATPTAESGSNWGFKALVTGTTRAVGAGSGLVENVAEYYTTDTSDGVDISGQAITATLADLLPAEGDYATAGLLKPGETFTLTFNVIIQ